jgi:hypothetical protein
MSTVNRVIPEAGQRLSRPLRPPPRYPIGRQKSVFSADFRSKRGIALLWRILTGIGGT